MEEPNPTTTKHHENTNTTVKELENKIEKSK